MLKKMRELADIG